METEKRRIRLWVSYDGTNYSGWQIQPLSPTIEGELDRAIFRLTKEEIHVIGASRTDAGVHAYSNVCVFDTTMRMPAEKFAYALNSFLPEDIVVLYSEEVDLSWHPRHCDCKKTYEYRLELCRFQNPQRLRYATPVREKLDIEKMKEAAKYFVGTYDFTSFCAAATIVEDKIRTIYSVEVIQEAQGVDAYMNRFTDADNSGRELVIRVTGNGFLYNMVRIIAGTLIDVGKGKKNPGDILKIIAAKDRKDAGPTAPAKGLTLCKIEYEN